MKHYQYLIIGLDQLSCDVILSSCESAAFLSLSVSTQIYHPSATLHSDQRSTARHAFFKKGLVTENTDILSVSHLINPSTSPDATLRSRCTKENTHVCLLPLIRRWNRVDLIILLKLIHSWTGRGRNHLWTMCVPHI